MLHLLSDSEPVVTPEKLMCVYADLVSTGLASSLGQTAEVPGVDSHYYRYHTAWTSTKFQRLRALQRRRNLL